ncbi:putative LRR receptor-like serine/threonine-protein kinase At1g51820, partial [Wolffia australiana]
SSIPSEYQVFTFLSSVVALFSSLLQEVIKLNTKYRVTGEFGYANYNGLGRPPRFDLYLGVNLWTTVESRDHNLEEIIFIAGGESVQVCLVNTGGGTPFISVLDLRPVPSSLYSSLVKPSQAVLLKVPRGNFGATDFIRYPEDPYDRLWLPLIEYTQMSKTVDVKRLNNEYMAPAAVLETGITTLSMNESFKIETPGTYREVNIYVLYFNELQLLRLNQIREFDVYADNEFVYGPVRPPYVVITKPPGLPGGLTFSLRPTLKSTLPPLINAMEILVLQQLPLLPTNQVEVEAMFGLKKFYQVSRNWEGDPCTPEMLSWQGVGCSLSSSEKYATITTLDMSYNNITGKIPSYVWQLPDLKFLNLASYPYKITDGASGIEARVNNNPFLCTEANICNTTPDISKTKRKKIIFLAVTASASVLLILVIVAFCTVKKTKAQEKSKVIDEKALTWEQREKGHQNSIWAKQEDAIHTESHIFSVAEILDITNNFQQPISRGGFGIVYLGRLGNGRQVAVKVVSRLSKHGEKQFRAEAQLLTRVHHKHLVKLLGYCEENLALVYEFVSHGSLYDHLLGVSKYKNLLSWDLRLQIAIESAQGLDYLHYGCTPPIIHRDVKASNILLNEKFEAKLADFGLSRSYTHSDGSVDLSTVVAGTPGYIDPECVQTNRMTEKSDIYSFGIVLLELVTGRPAIDMDRTHITQGVQIKLEQGDICSIVDPRIEGDYELNAVWKFIDISLACTSLNSKERPTISDVVVQLKDCQSLQSFKKSRGNEGTGSIFKPSSYSIPNISPSSR